MKGWTYILLLLMFIYANAPAQNTFAFKAQLYHNKLGPQKNVSVLLDNQYTAVTNDAGVFIVNLPKGTNHIKVSLATNTYNILYPYGGYVLVPRDVNDVPQVIIGNIKENDYLNQYLSVYKLLKNKPTTDPNMLLLKNKMDSLEILLTKLHYSQNELRTAKQIQDGKDDYLPEISADIIDYKAKAFDLKTAFQYVSEYAFDNANALQKLAEAITNYNYSYSKLDRQRINYEKRIADYWQSETLRTSYRNLVSFAIDTLHSEKIFPMQQTIAQIREYFDKRNKSNDLKKSIQQKINEQVQQLDMLLPKLDKQSAEVLSALAD